MKVNFDAMRKRGVFGFNLLVKELNRRIHDDDRINEGPNGDSLCVGDIQNEIEDIRYCLATLICLEDEKNNIKCLDLKLEVFAPENN